MMPSFMPDLKTLLKLILRCPGHRVPFVRLATLVSLGLLALLASMAQAQTQTTALRQQQIYLGDIAELTIEYESGIPSLYAIDTSILTSDFIVLDTRSSVSRVLEGKQMLHRMHWAVQLVPRRSGSLRIPSLKFGENHSEPMLLEVKPASELQQTRQSVFVEVEAHPQNPYPGQQTRVVTRLFHNLELYDVALAEPKTPQVQVIRSGRELGYSTTRGDTRYQVLERSIVLIPKADQALSIEPAIYRGSIRPGNVTTNALSTRYIYRQSNSLSLKLRALPPGFDGALWLPARRIELELDWDKMDASPRPGDSLGVTLKLRATGLPGEALPADLLLRESEQYRIYADQETRSTQLEGAPGEEQFSGSLQQRYVIVFDQPGEISLPGLDLHWWNLDREAAALASVAATGLTVIASEASAATSSLSNGSLDGIHRGQGISTRGLLPPGLYQYGAWLLLLASGLLMLVLSRVARPLYVRLLAGLRLANRRRHCLQILKLACRSNDAPQARQELIAWGRAHWRDHRISGLHQIARRGRSARWIRELAQLDAAVFAPAAGDWQGAALWELIQQEYSSSSVNKQTRSSLLPGLYPEHGS